jgi:hypothetical protein
MEIWSNPANWTTIQWMAVCIMAFVIVAIVVMVKRLLVIIKMSKTQAYKPNLRRLRTSHTAKDNLSGSDDSPDK